VKQHLNNLYNYLAEKGAEDARIYDLSNEDQHCDYIFVASIDSSENNKKLALEIMQEFEMEKYPEGFHKGEWIVFDLGRCVLHLFVSSVREKYNLDKLWQSKKMAI